MLKTVDVFGVPVSSTSIAQACETIDGWIRERKKVYICVAPVSTIVDSRAQADYKCVLEGAAMVTPDGMPVVWTARLMGDKNIERTYGPDLMLALCDRGQKLGYRHYLYGGMEKTCSLLENVLKSKFPDIRICGSYAPSYRATMVEESRDVIDSINRANPDILWVGLGSPKQDHWMKHHRHMLNVPVMIGVGAAFDFLAGTKKQAPHWMRRAGLEWLFRLCCEPKRLWKRYLIGNTKFIFLFMSHFFKGQFRKKT